MKYDLFFAEKKRVNFYTALLDFLHLQQITDGNSPTP